MPLKLVPGPRPETRVLGTTLTSATNLQPDLRHSMLPAHTKIDQSGLPACTGVTADRLQPTSTQNQQRSNPHSARGTLTHSNTAVSSLGGFRTPAPQCAAPSVMGPPSENLHRDGGLARDGRASGSPLTADPPLHCGELRVRAKERTRYRGSALRAKRRVGED